MKNNSWTSENSFAWDYYVYKSNDLRMNNAIKAEIKQAKLDDLRRAVTAFERGHMTIDETMNLISRI